MLAEFVIEKIERDRHNGTNSNNSLPGKLIAAADDRRCVLIHV